VSKLVKLKIGKATTNNSYQVCLQISQKQISQISPIEVEGELPIPSKLLQAHQDWRRTYDLLDLSRRGDDVEFDTDLPANISINERIEECENAGKKVIELFNFWLKSDSFAEVSGSLQEELGSTDEIQTFLQIDESLPDLARLPWQETDFFKRDRLTEVALIKQKTNKIEIPPPTNSQVRILAVLGNSKNIDLKEDRKSLESSGAYVRYLESPNQESLFDALSKQQWDIFFFAGHSSSVGAQGKIYVNNLDRGLTFEDISTAVKRAIRNSLKIAILNSCDGLELGKSLSELQVPQIIFMREPVPDLVAHTFLKEFISQYSSEGKSFYSSVRYAREELQKLQDKFPCATWLPTIYQSSTDYPPSWEELQGTTKKKARIDIHWSFKVIALVIIILSLIPRTQVFAVGIEQSIQSLVRMTVLRDKSPVEQSIDLPVDKIRPSEKPKLVLIHIDEDSLIDLGNEKSKTQTGKFNRNPIDKEYLANIIKKLTRAGVKSIAVDYILDKPSQDKSDKFLNMAIQEAIDEYQVRFLFASEEKDESQVSIISNPTIDSQQSIVIGDISLSFYIELFKSIQPYLIQYIQPWKPEENEQILFSYSLAMMQEQPQNRTMDNWMKNTIQNSKIIPVINPIPLLTSLTIDYSRSPDSIYNRISAKQFLKTPKSPALDNPTDKVVLIAPGGYPEATTNLSQLGDNYEIPLAISLRSLVEQKKYIDKGRPFTGGEIHAYIASQLLTKDEFITKSVLIRVSDLLMVLIAMVMSHYVVKYYTRKNIVVILVYGSVIYIIFCLTVYSIANIMIPFVFPCATTALAYILPIRRIKNRA
jgi:CHASE2 domain-containing sensor protein